MCYPGETVSANGRAIIIGANIERDPHGRDYVVTVRGKGYRLTFQGWVRLCEHFRARPQSVVNILRGWNFLQHSCIPRRGFGSTKNDEASRLRDLSVLT